MPHMLFCFLVDGIGCYVCKSVNGSDPRCEDEFNAYPATYKDSCTAARKGRTGKFPATSCIKFKASRGEQTSIYSAACHKLAEGAVLIKTAYAQCAQLKPRIQHGSFAKEYTFSGTLILSNVTLEALIIVLFLFSAKCCQLKFKQENKHDPSGSVINKKAAVFSLGL